MRAVPRPRTHPPCRPHRCAWPESAVVPSCARCTEVEAAAGERPEATRTVDEVMPYPMPSEPSTSCATKPARVMAASRSGSLSASDDASDAASARSEDAEYRVRPRAATIMEAIRSALPVGLSRENSGGKDGDSEGMTDIGLLPHSGDCLGLDLCGRKSADWNESARGVPFTVGRGHGAAAVELCGEHGSGVLEHFADVPVTSDA
eukprot:scaffold36662_cov36-Phaeocystis_antarctica.AAC.3